MSRSARLIVGGIVVVLVVVLIGLVYIWVSGGSAEPSGTLVAPTLELATRAPTTEPTEAPTETSTPEAAAATEDMATETSTPPTETPAEPTAESAASDAVIFSIIADDSEVRFILDELLRGSPNTVTGRTNQIAGQIGVDFANPQNSQVGEIRINARTLATDNEMRNRAIRSAILQSAQDEFEFISFQPTALDGLPASVTMGEAFTFQITGDLTIRDVTNPVTFDVTVTPVSETRIEGTATATIQREDYGLTIPNVPGVADVDEAVKLEIDFAATAGT